MTLRLSRYAEFVGHQNTRFGIGLTLRKRLAPDIGQRRSRKDGAGRE
jgi:hypothetical protein